MRGSRLIQEQAYAVNEPLVVSETIDDETIIMHHGSGHYFNCTGSAVLIWSLIEHGAGIRAIAGRLASAFGLTQEQALDVVGGFVSTLVEHDLIRPGPANDLAGREEVWPVKGAFNEPVLGVHTDLADMLLLDPVHDVDEVGWPAPKPPGSAA